MTFSAPLDPVDAEERPLREQSKRGAPASGTPFLSFFRPDEMPALACEAGFTSVEHVSPADLTTRYFANRTDGLRPSSSEHLIIATVISLVRIVDGDHG